MKVESLVLFLVIYSPGHLFRRAVTHQMAAAKATQKRAPRGKPREGGRCPFPLQYASSGPQFFPQSMLLAIGTTLADHRMISLWLIRDA